MGQTFDIQEAFYLILSNFNVFSFAIFNFRDDFDGYSLALIKRKLRDF
jgi:hypothetical protein